jgi:hypothetical protein
VKRAANTRIFGGEDFDCCRPDCGNKSTADRGSDDGRVAIFAAASTHPLRRPIFSEALMFCRRKGIGDMRQLGSLLRSTRSRIGRRLALIVAIAAASLPAAGA